MAVPGQVILTELMPMVGAAEDELAAEVREHARLPARAVVREVLVEGMEFARQFVHAMLEQIAD